MKAKYEKENKGGKKKKMSFSVKWRSGREWLVFDPEKDRIAGSTSLENTRRTILWFGQIISRLCYIFYFYISGLLALFYSEWLVKTSSRICIGW